MNSFREDRNTLIMLNKQCLILMCFFVLILFISACSKTDNSQFNNNNSKTGVSIPSVVALTILPSDGSKTAVIYMDDNTTPEDQRVLDANATEVVFQLTVPAGEHTFKIVFQYDDQTWGLF